MLKRIFKKIFTFLITIAVLGFIVAGALLIWNPAAKTIGQLLQENKQLQNAIVNLTAERQIGYAKIISMEEKNGKIFTRLKFVETDRNDMLKRILEKEYEIEGDIIHFDALIIKFDQQLVMDGKERTIYLWRRIYSDKMNPQDGFPIEIQGGVPERYNDISSKLKIEEGKIFWQEIWKLADDKDYLAKYGITAIYGNVIYRKVKPGLVYIFKIGSTGNLYPETIPDL